MVVPAQPQRVPHSHIEAQDSNLAAKIIRAAPS
jgi:hypothetical protein